MLQRLRPAHWICRRSLHGTSWLKRYYPPTTSPLRHPTPLGSCKFYATSAKLANETFKKKVEVQDTRNFEILSLTLHDLMSHSEGATEGENQCVELIVPRYSNNEGTEQMPIYNEVYFEPVEYEMNDLIFNLQRDIVHYNRWIVTAKATSMDSIDITLLPYADGKFCMYVFTKPEYHRDFMNSFGEGVEGLHYDATSKDKKINVQKVKSTDLQNVVAQLKKGNTHKIAQVSTPGTQLMKRNAAPKPPTSSAEAEQDMLYRLNHTMEAKGASMVGGYMMQAMEQGCDLMFIDHGQRHGLRLVGEQMEALIDTGYSVFVERLIENNDILDQQFLHFNFVVLLNKKITVSSGRPSLSNISDKEGKVYIRVFTHMMWAVQHIQYCEMKANPKKEEGNAELSKEEQEKLFREEKGKLQKVIASDKEKKKRKKSEVEAPKKTEEEKRGKEGDGRMYTCTRLTGYQLLKMVQRAPTQITGGIIINNGVSNNLCKVAHNVTVKTEEIVEWDVDTAFTSDPVYRPYQ